MGSSARGSPGFDTSRLRLSERGSFSGDFVNQPLTMPIN
jgi:hypothetical protein